MFGRKKKTTKKPCDHCIHDTGKTFKQKERHWNKCKKEPYYYKHRTQGQCCKCKGIAYKRTSLFDKDKEKEHAVEVPPDKELKPFLDSGWL